MMNTAVSMTSHCKQAYEIELAEMLIPICAMTIPMAAKAAPALPPGVVSHVAIISTGFLLLEESSNFNHTCLQRKRGPYHNVCP